MNSRLVALYYYLYYYYTLFYSVHRRKQMHTEEKEEDTHTHTHRLACFHMCVWVFLRCAHISDGKLKVNWDVSPSMKAVGLAHTMCAWNEAQNTVHTRYSSHISVLMYELVMPAVLLLLMLWWSWSSFSATDYRGNVALRCFCSRQYCTNTF